jgi:hypothetical protein
MYRKVEGKWVEVPVDRIELKIDPDRGPVRLRLCFADGTRRIIPVDLDGQHVSALEEILCDKGQAAKELPAPCWWG